jgi:hypothetical protein
MKMAKKQLRKRQRAVIEELVSGEMDEQAVLRKHKVRRRTFDGWVVDPVFSGELERRVSWLKRQSELILARCKSVAAARLAELTGSEKEETARRACMDIIGRDDAKEVKSNQGGEKEEGEQDVCGSLRPETASRLLAVLAEEGKEGVAGM